MPRLLIVSPHFPPVNAPDMQRVRMSLPHFVAAGWEVTVLTVDDSTPLAPLEPALLQTVPAGVRVVRAPALSRRWTRWIGLNNLGLRALPFLYLAGRRLLRGERFDLVYFSTTQFIVLPLGRLWRGAVGVPYVIDLQDPWLNDYYERPGVPAPPGGWKYAVARWQARLLEGWTLRKCSHVISVSADYLASFARRYSWWTPDRGSVLTFGAPEADLQFVRSPRARRQRLLPDTPALKIVYAGRLGPDMLPALEVLFAGLASHHDSGGRLLELHLSGTSYASADRVLPTTTEAARRHGTGHQVHESPGRIGYLDALQLMLEGDCVLLLGSEDKAYSPSKIYPALLTGRPVLAVAPAGSILEHKITELGGAGLVTFQTTPAGDPAAVGRVRDCLARLAAGNEMPLGQPLRRDVLREKYSATAIAEAQLRIFGNLLESHRSA